MIRTPGGDGQQLSATHGAAVLEALAGTGLPLRARQRAVKGLPGSGTPDELMDAAGISASRIAVAARGLLKRLKEGRKRLKEGHSR